MAHRHRQRAVGARLGRQPLVGELHVVGVVRATPRRPSGRGSGPRPSSARPGCGSPGRSSPTSPGTRRPTSRRTPARRSGRRTSAARRPAGRRTSRRTTASTPPISDRNRAPTACDTIDIAGIGENPATRSGPYSLDRVHVRGGDDLLRLVPADPHQAALAAGLLVAAPALRVGLDVGPRRDRVTAEPGLGLPVHLHQHAAGVRVAHPGRRVGVPGERRARGGSRAARTPAGPAPTLG